MKTVFRQHPAPRINREHGYMLLFALGLLVVASAFILAVTTTQRIDVQLLTHEKTALQNHYRIEGAAEYTAAQLTIASAVAFQRVPPDDPILQDWVLWRPGADAFDLELEGGRFEVLLQDLTGLPDANMLTAAEWQRLFTVVGVTNAQRAGMLAAQLLAFKAEIGRVTGMAAFSSLEQLFKWEGFAPEMVDGGTEQVPLGLRQLITLGTLRKDVHIDLTPLPLFKVLGNVTDEHLRKLAAMRLQGAVPPSEAVQWIQGTGLSAPVVMAPASVAATIRLREQAAAALTFTIANQDGVYKVVDRAQLRAP